MKGKPLSPRELEVLGLVWQGFTTRQIAHMLHRSFNTIAMHRQHILTKLDVTSTTEALNKAMVLGILDTNLPTTPDRGAA
jgi:DNA-binding NarL/FixJ family response regulator